MKQLVEVTGVIQSGEETVEFTVDDFTFLRAKAFDPIGSNRAIVITPDKYGYIYGKTHDGHNIAIYTRDALDFITTMKLKTWCYIISNENIQPFEFQSFDGIAFKGGIMNVLYPPKSLKTNFDETRQDKIVVDVIDHDLKYEVDNKFFSGTIIISSEISMGHQNTTGYCLTNGNSCLELLLEDGGNLNDFETYFVGIRTLCQFMSFRENTGFDTITFLKKHDEIASDFYTDCATCYVRSEKDLTKKDYHRCITFSMLNQTVMSNLLFTIMENTENKPSYCINFLPEDDDDAVRMNNIKIRNICSAIECEMALANIQCQDNLEFKALVERIKNVIQEHRGGPNPLDKKTYDYLFGSISHWDEALADRIYEAYKLHEGELRGFLREIHRARLSYEEFEKLVKYRNSITHGMYKENNMEIVTAAMCVMALVYCCLLSRVGMSSEQISEIMANGVLLYTE